MIGRSRDAPIATERLRRNAYLIGLPVGILACLVGWLLQPADGGALGRWALLGLAGWFALLTPGFALWHSRFRALEITLFASLCLYLLGGLGMSLSGTYGGQYAVATRLGEFGYWFPTLYALAFLCFGAQRGRRVALTVFTLSLAAGFFYLTLHLIVGNPLSELRGLGQFYLAGAVVILVFVTFASLVETHQGIASDMEWLANTDQLTRIANRRRTEEALAVELERGTRYGSVFSLLLIDIDHFKAINDRHGHSAGDVVLRRVAELLRRQIRAIDHVGRWGGEEFVVVSPGIEQREAVMLATRLKSLVGAQDFEMIGNVTISLGVATFEHGDTVDALLQRADGALYRAKEAGRNRVMVA